MYNLIPFCLLKNINIKIAMGNSIVASITNLSKIQSFIIVSACIFLMVSCDYVSRFASANKEIRLFPVSVDDQYQYIDKEGKIIVTPQFSEVSIYRDGLALVKSTGDSPRWGFIDESGKYVINTQYVQATVFSEGIAWAVMENQGPMAIGKFGEILFSLNEAQNVAIFSEGLAAFSITDSSGLKCGFVDNRGIVKITPQFFDAGNFSDGMCFVMNKERKFGYINKDGNLVVNYQFDAGLSFSNGVAPIMTNGKWGTIDKSGKYVINPQFDHIVVDGDYFKIKMGDKYGWCDKKGKIVINPQFEAAYPFMGNKLAPVKVGKLYGFVDTDGKIAINPQFDYALPFNGNIAAVKSGDRYGFIDLAGKFIINPQYEELADDYSSFVRFGYTSFDIVSSDYFNVEAITERFNFNNPEGLALNEPFSMALNKFNLSDSDFNQYTSEHTVLFGGEISRDADLNYFKIIGTPYSEIMDGWYPRQVFDSSKSMTGFIWSIVLKGKGIGKATDVIKAFEQKLIGYSLLPDESNDQIRTYLGKNSKITISSFSNEITIQVRLPESDSWASPTSISSSAQHYPSSFDEVNPR